MFDVLEEDLVIWDWVVVFVYFCFEYDVIEWVFVVMESFYVDCIGYFMNWKIDKWMFVFVVVECVIEKVFEIGMFFEINF